MPLPGMAGGNFALFNSFAKRGQIFQWLTAWLLLLTTWLGAVEAMRSSRIAELRQETVDMFYHGYDNYMSVAFPEDEVFATIIHSSRFPYLY